MAALVLLEHDAHGIKQPSRSAVAAAQKLGEVHALVVGSGIASAAEAGLETARRRARDRGRCALLRARARRAGECAARGAGAELHAFTGRRDRIGEKHHAACGGAARRSADQRYFRR